MSERRINVYLYPEQASRFNDQNLNKCLNQSKEKQDLRGQRSEGNRNSAFYRSPMNLNDEKEIQKNNNESLTYIEKQANEEIQESENRYQTKQQRAIAESSLDDFDIWKKVDEILKRIKFKKYIRTFLSLSRLRLYRLLTPIQLMKIGDLSYWHAQIDDHNKSQVSTLNKNIMHSTQMSIIQRILSINIPIFLPHNKFLEAWQFLKICSVMLCFFCYLVCFSLNKDIEELFNLDLLILCQVFMVLDIFINLNTGIYIKGILCTDRKELFNYYKSSKTFYYDISSTFFTTLYFVLHFNGIPSSRGMLALLLPILFKHNDFYIIIKKIKEKFLLDRKMQNIIELINLLKNILLISHIFACIWLMVGLTSFSIYSDAHSQNYKNNTTVEDNSQPYSWLELMNLQDERWVIQYLNSYYFITVTMSTVGYGDIRPTNPIEVCVCIFLMMTCCVIFGFTLNSIGEIFQDFFAIEKIIQEKRCIIASYMKKNDINQNTRMNIFEYLEIHLPEIHYTLKRYFWKEQISENKEEESKIISQLSDNLKEELLIQSNKLILKENKVLREFFSPEILAKCIPIINEQRLTPGEIIIDQQLGNTDCCIYFVLFGEIEVIRGLNLDCKKTRPQNQNIITIVKKEIILNAQGDSFGERCFFTGEQDSLNMKIRSRGFSKILKIKREHFIKLLEEDRQQYEIFRNLSDKLTFSQDLSCLQLKCSFCRNYMHDVSMCPSIHYIPRKMKIFGNNQASKAHLDRNKSFQRSRQFKQNCLEQLDITQELFEYYKDLNYEDIIKYEDDNLKFESFQRSKPTNLSDDDLDNMPKTMADLLKFKQPNTIDLLQSPQHASERRRVLSFTKRMSNALNNNGQIQNQNGLLSQLIGSCEQNEGSSKEQIHNKQQDMRQVQMQLRKQISQNSGQDSDIMPSKLARQQTLKDFDYSELLLQNHSQQSQSPIERQISFNRLQFFKKQISKDVSQNHVLFEANMKQCRPESISKLGKQTILLESRDANYNLTQEYQEFDLLQGKFERMNHFQNYFPKQNYKNIINKFQALQSLQLRVIIMKDSNKSQLNKKLNQRNFQNILKEREIVSCRSLSRIKLVGQALNTFDKNTHDKSITPLTQQNINNQNLEQKDTFKEASICNYLQDQTNLDDSSHPQILYEDPTTPPRNEQIICVSGIPSIGIIKNSFYNFGSLDPSSFLHSQSKIFNEKL